MSSNRQIKPSGGRRPNVKPVNINSFLLLGIIIVAAAAVLNAVFPDWPKGIFTILYVVGILALIMYMWEIQYRRRTGDYNDESQGVKGKKRK